MDPNSQNQRWSKWEFEILPGRLRRPSFDEIKLAAAKFGRLHFGSAGAMKIDDLYDTVPGRRRLVILIRVEGVPVHDPQYVAFTTAEWNRWAIRGFGNGTTCRLVEARLEAGTRQDGSPRDQLVIFDAEAMRIRLTN